MKLLITEDSFLNKIPELPGVYRFFSAKIAQERELLYVGKALNLRKRIKSYFQKVSGLSPRISLMVKKIELIELTVTDNEISALILENNLIKSLKPKYNIIFRDDKTYPLIRISNDDFPRIDSYRGKIEQNTKYFGPYPNVQAMHHSLDMIQRIFRLRTCKDLMFNSRSRPCILYQIKRCTAPCVGLISKDTYAQQVKSAIDFLNGNYQQAIRELNVKMMEYAAAEDFENAAMVRDELGFIKAMSIKQIINNYKKPIDTDIIVVKQINLLAYFYIIMIRGGTYISDNCIKLKNPDGDIEDVFRVFLENYYFDKVVDADLLNKKFEIRTKVVVGEETKLFFKTRLKIIHNLDNVFSDLYQMGEKNLAEIVNKGQDGEVLIGAVAMLTETLGLEKIERIECIDVSHNQGQNTVASIVVFENGKMNNKLYKKYNLTVDVNGNPINGNDLAALEVVLLRRFMHQEIKHPEVFLIDGGVNQLGVAKRVLAKYHLEDKIQVLGVFKGEKRDPMKDILILPDGRIALATADVALFKIIHILRDEAHRFAITGHRKKETKRMSHSKLDDIPNIGIHKKQALLSHFGSYRNVTQASLADLSQVDGVGKILARQIYQFFQEKKGK